MSGPADSVGARATELRAAFDRAFEDEPPRERAGAVDVLSLGIAGDRFAVRVRDLAGIARCGTLAPVPSRAAALLGLAGLRGDLVPVYSLAKLLGYARADEPAWLLLCGTAQRFGLAVGEYHGCFTVEAGAFGGRSENARSRKVVKIQGHVHTVVAIDAIARTVTSEEES